MKIYTYFQFKLKMYIALLTFCRYYDNFCKCFENVHELKAYSAEKITAKTTYLTCFLLFTNVVWLDNTVLWITSKQEANLVFSSSDYEKICFCMQLTFESTPLMTGVTFGAVQNINWPVKWCKMSKKDLHWTTCMDTYQNDWGHREL